MHPKESAQRLALPLWQEQWFFLGNGGLHSKAAESLSHFAAERAATDDQQASWELG